MAYSDVIGHRSMVFDTTRNDAYAAAIERLVTPDSVVLDLGCGLGIHGLIAARAGARKVFLVDPEIVVECAREVAVHNGYGQQIQAFRGRIEDIELPEKVDLIISVFTGNLLYSEDLLPSLFFARDRWLRPGGKLIPDAAELLCAPVTAPYLRSDRIESWSQPHLGFDYSPMRRFAGNAMTADREAKALPQLLADPAVVATSDFTCAKETNLDATVQFEVHTAALCDGLHGWIRIKVGDQWLATGPGAPPMHWTPQTLLVDPPLALEAGQQLDLRLRRPAFGDWTWDLAASSGRRRSSTFLSQPAALAQFAMRSPSASPRLDSGGEAALRVLQGFAEGAQSQRIAADLTVRFPSKFPDAGRAMQFVGAMAVAYCENQRPPTLRSGPHLMASASR